MLLRRACALLLVWCAGLPAMAAEGDAASASVDEPVFVSIPLVAAERQGYAFTYPRVLSQQRLFGVQHGVNLLAQACTAIPAQAEAVAEAYASWRTRQQALLDSLQRDLAQYYFGPRADEANALHLIRALNLRERLALSPDSAELAAACTSLPQALSLPRYDLSSSFALDEAQAATLLALRANIQTEKCSEALPELAESLAAGLKDWQSRNDEPAKQAQLNVSELWPRAGRAGSADQWLKAVSKHLATPAPATCKQLPSWLVAEASSLASSFQAPPLPVALETLLPADAPTAITSAVTLPLTQPPAVAAPVASTVAASEPEVGPPAVAEPAPPAPAAVPPAAATTPEAAPVEPVPALPPASVALEAPPSMPAAESEPASTLLYLYELLMSVLSND